MNQRVLWNDKYATVTDENFKVLQPSMSNVVFETTSYATYPLAAVSSVGYRHVSGEYWKGVAMLGLTGVLGVPMAVVLYPIVGPVFAYGVIAFALLSLVLAVLTVGEGMRARVVCVGLSSGGSAKVKVPNEKVASGMVDALNLAVREWNARQSVPSGVANELARLAELRDAGVLSQADWEQAKGLFLGKPISQQDQAVALLRQLHDLRVAGVLSESEFNMKKWEVLSTA